MDTRAKIVCGPGCASRLEQLRRDCPGVRAVSGYFDPVLSWHARRLAAERGAAPGLAAVILDPPDPVLPARARAELVAALNSVSLVLLPDGTAALDVDAAFESEDLAERERFAAHVLERQS